MPTLKGEFELAGWDESTYLELEGERRLTRASVKQNISGDISGSGEVEYLMCYAEDGTARFLGFQRVTGSVQGRDGSFVLESVGGFDGGRAFGTWSVVPGSGSEGLAGISGEGRFEAPKGPNGTYELDATLD
jgi:Protein of unknown function (DUF3224)